MERSLNTEFISPHTHLFRCKSLNPSHTKDIHSSVKKAHTPQLLLVSTTRVFKSTRRALEVAIYRPGEHDSKTETGLSGFLSVGSPVTVAERANEKKKSFEALWPSTLLAEEVFQELRLENAPSARAPTKTEINCSNCRSASHTWKKV